MSWEAATNLQLSLGQFPLSWDRLLCHVVVYEDGWQPVAARGASLDEGVVEPERGTGAMVRS